MIIYRSIISLLSVAIMLAGTLPTHAKELKPGLLYLHGHVLEKVGSRTYNEYNLKKITNTFTDEGFVVSAPLRDADQSLRAEIKTIQQQYKQLRNDPAVDRANIYVMGFSEGCKLAGLVVGKGKITPAGLVLAACFPSKEDSGHKDWQSERKNYQKNLRNTDGLTMPTLLLSNRFDKQSNTNGNELSALLEEQGTPVAQHRIAGSAGHEVFYDHTTTWVNQVSKFIRHQRPYKKLFE